MGAQLRVYRRRIRSVADDEEDHPGDGADRGLAHRQGAGAGRGVRAVRRASHRARSRRWRPTPNVDHPLLTEREQIRAGRGPGGHHRPRPGRRLQLERDQGGRAAAALLRGRGQGGRALRRRPQGRGVLRLPQPAGRASRGPASPSSRTFDDAEEIGETLIEAFVSTGRRPSGGVGIDEIHIVYTEFSRMLTQTPRSSGLLPAGGRRGASRQPAPDEAAPAVRVRAGRQARARRAAAALHREPDLQRAAAVGRLRARRPAAGDEAATDNADELIKTLHPAGRTRPARPRSPRKSARSSAAPTRWPTRTRRVTSDDMTAT